MGAENQVIFGLLSKRDSTWLPGNTMVLYGPTGTGKTSAVYAIAKELKFNVLELNASTKRTGALIDFQSFFRTEF